MPSPTPEPMQGVMDVQVDVNRAWRDVEDAVLRLQQAAERARKALAEVSSSRALGPEAWRLLDPLLCLEELSVDLALVVDEAKGSSARLQAGAADQTARTDR